MTGLAPAAVNSAAACGPVVQSHCDDGGWVILLERMDQAAMTASVELAAGKAQCCAFQEAHPGAGGSSQPRSVRGDNPWRFYRDARRPSDRGRRRGDRGIGAIFATPEEDEQIPRRASPRLPSDRVREPASVPERSLRPRVHCCCWPPAVGFGPAPELQLPRNFQYATAGGRGRT